MIKIDTKEWICFKCGTVNCIHNTECENCHTKMKDNYIHKTYLNQKEKAILLCNQDITTLKSELNIDSALAQWAFSVALEDSKNEEKIIEREFWRQCAMFGGNLMALASGILKLDGTESKGFYEKLKKTIENINEKDYEELDWLLQSYKKKDTQSKTIKQIKKLCKTNCKMLISYVGVILMRKGRLEEAEEWLQMTGIDIYADNAKEIKELMEEFQNIIKE